MSYNEWCLVGCIELYDKQIYNVVAFFENTEKIKFNEEWVAPDVTPIEALLNFNPKFQIYTIGNSKEFNEVILHYFKELPSLEEINKFLASLFILQNPNSDIPEIVWIWDT
jgi:hypothetical protein